MPRSLSCRDCLRLLRESRVDDFAPFGGSSRSEASRDGAQSAPSNLTAHLDACPDCAREARLYAGISADLRALTLPAPPLDLRDRVRRTIQAEDAAQAARQRTPWYLAPWLLSGGAATVAAMLMLMVYLRAPHNNAEMRDMTQPSGTTADSPAVAPPSEASRNTGEMAQSDAPAGQGATAAKQGGLGRADEKAQVPTTGTSRQSERFTANPAAGGTQSTPAVTTPQGMTAAQTKTLDAFNKATGAAPAPNGQSSSAQRTNPQAQQTQSPAGGAPETQSAPPSALPSPGAAKPSRLKSSGFFRAEPPAFVATLRVVPVRIDNSDGYVMTRRDMPSNARALTVPSPTQGSQESVAGAVAAPVTPSSPASGLDSPQAPVTNADGVGNGGGMGGRGARGQGGFASAQSRAMARSGSTSISPEQGVGQERLGDASTASRAANPQAPNPQAPNPQVPNTQVPGSATSDAVANVRSGQFDRNSVGDFKPQGATQGTDAATQRSMMQKSVAPKLTGRGAKQAGKRRAFAPAKQSEGEAKSLNFYGLSSRTTEAVLEVKPTRDLQNASLQISLPPGVTLLAPQVTVLSTQATRIVATVWRGSAKRGQPIRILLRLGLRAREDQVQSATKGVIEGVMPPRDLQLILRGTATTGPVGLEHKSVVSSQSIRFAP